MSKRIKIGYFADGPWSHRAFELIVADPALEIKFIVPRKDTTDKVLREYAAQYHIDILDGISVNSEDFYQQALNYECDLFVSMSYNQIFRERITNLPPLGTINCHAGKLPFYRGRNILNWALINDEKEFGITVHYVDQSIDTGDIVLQRTYSITETDDYATLLSIAHLECAVILYDAIKLIQNEKVDRIKQLSIHPVGSYFGVRKEGDEIIDWRQTSREVFNFIRAICAPGPRARTFLNGQEIFINKAATVAEAPVYKSIPGMITGISPRGYFVKTTDSIIEIYEVESSAKIRVGDRFQ